MGGGGGGGEESEKCPRRFQLSRISLIFKQYLPNVATFTKIYWKTRLCKKFASRVSLVGMATPFLTQCLLKFWLFKDFSPLINEIFKKGLIVCLKVTNQLINNFCNLMNVARDL